MAISATFLADFTQFTSAVDGASARLVGLQKTTGDVAAETGVSFDQMAKTVRDVGAAVTVVSGFVSVLGTRGADVADVKEHFENLTKSIGPTKDVMNLLKESTLGTVTQFDLMKITNTSLSQGLKLTKDQLQLAADAAAVLADRTGVDVKTAFNTLMTAMATGQDRQLKNIGLNIDAAEATTTYAREIGKAVGQLSEEDKKQAIVNAILKSSQDVLDRSGKAQEDFGDKTAQTTVKLRNMADGIGVWMASMPSIGAWASKITAVAGTVTALSVAWGPMAAAFGAMAGWLTPLIALIGTSLTGAFSAILPFLGPIGWIAVGVIAVVTAWKNWDKISGFVKGVYDAVKTWLVDRFTSVMATIKGYIDTIIGWWQSMLATVGGGSSVVPPGVGLGGGRASGGPVSGGTAYMVGERGPELFVPRTSGSIVPNGGGGTMVVQLVMADGRELAAATVPWIPGELRRIGVA